MKRILILFGCFFILSGDLAAQTVRFVTSGTIEFEKSINMYAIIKRSWFGDYERYYEANITNYKNGAQPQFKLLKSSLAFSGEKTLFTPDKPEIDRYSMTYYDSRPLVDQNSTIYSDLSSGNSVTQKNVYGDLFVLKDSVRNIKWRLTDETREIAGYSCRRANGLMMDSIYVVAFYTGEIPISGGPESFSGLPGMILGAVLPHENISWFAKKVTPAALAPTAVQPPAPKKAKIVTNKEFRATLESSSYIKQWGKGYAQLYLKGFML